MKIGLSYSRCVKDIYDKKVNINEVLVIIGRTNFDPRIDTDWNKIWEWYRIHEWTDLDQSHETSMRTLTTELYTGGLLHQPRQFGAFKVRLPYHWLETILPSSELDLNPALKDAWENFQVMAQLVSFKLDKQSGAGYE